MGAIRPAKEFASEGVTSYAVEGNNRIKISEDLFARRPGRLLNQKESTPNPSRSRGITWTGCISHRAQSKVAVMNADKLRRLTASPEVAHRRGCEERDWQPAEMHAEVV